MSEFCFTESHSLDPVNCGKELTEFEDISSRELAIPISGHDLVHSNISWLNYAEDVRGISDIGVYIIWERTDYCVEHGTFLIEALYVGKGRAARRIVEHLRTKPELWAAEEVPYYYYSFYKTSNRLAKYIEQLLLDLYDLPLNVAENTGSRPMYAILTQDEAS